MEGPNNGFSERCWNDNLPRDGRVQSPWELVQQSFTNIVAMKNPMWIITNTETTHVSPLRRRRRLDFSGGSWGRSKGSFAGESLMSMYSELSSIDFPPKFKILSPRRDREWNEKNRLVRWVWRENFRFVFCFYSKQNV